MTSWPGRTSLPPKTNMTSSDTQAQWPVRTEGRADDVDERPRAGLEIEPPEVVEASELALSAEDVQGVVHDDGGVSVASGWDADVWVGGGGVHFGVLAATGPALAARQTHPRG